MEPNKKAQNEAESDILFSKAVKAGQRIYYLDVKKNKRDELYLSITESKKLITGSADMPQYINSISGYMRKVGLAVPDSVQINSIASDTITNLQSND